MSVVFPYHKPVVFGHRGDRAHAPENTIAAFRQALEAGADGIELDARLTRDKTVMVHHDVWVDRISNGHGRLSAMTQSEVEKLDAGASFDRRFTGERIPTLQKVFETFGTRFIYDLEIKNLDAPFNGLEPRVLELVRRFGLEHNVIVTSFNPRSVHFFRKRLPEAPVGLLLVSGRLGGLEESLFSCWASDGVVGLASGEFSEGFKARQKGREILVWGVKTPEEVRSVVKVGAAAVVADDPGMARRALEGQ